MLKLAVVLAMMVGALATSGCIVQEQFACVGQKFVKCGDDWCKGDCTVVVKKTCDKKVLFKRKCELEDFCKEVKVPCGHDGNDEGGLFCPKGAQCVEAEECKLVRAETLSKGYYGSRKKLDSGYVEICEKKFTCGEVDPWALDAKAIEVVCKKEYEVVDDMDCPTLLADAAIFSKGLISKAKFLKMNHGKISCDKKLVGKLVCVEAEATIKGETCSDGSVCEAGYECASREVCSKVAVKKPVCAETPVFTCVTGSSGASLCGNKICSGGQRCEIIASKVCPVPLPVPTTTAGGVVVISGTPAGGAAVGGVAAGGVVVPGAAAGGVIAPGAAVGGVVVPGAGAGGVVAPGGGAGGVIVIPGGGQVVLPTPPPAPAGTVIIDGEAVPIASAASVSQADNDQVFSRTDSVNNGNVDVLNSAQATNPDGSFSFTLSDIVQGGLFTESDVNNNGGDVAEGQADGQIVQVTNGNGAVVADTINDAFASDEVVDTFIDTFAAPGFETVSDAFSTNTNTAAFSEAIGDVRDGEINVATDAFSAGGTASDAVSNASGGG